MKFRILPLVFLTFCLLAQNATALADNDVPSYRVRPGDLVAVAPKSKDLLVIKSALVSNERFEVPAWLEVDIEKLQGSVLALPERDQIDLEINEQLIVELYSK